jgi:hypothetical protein
VNLEGKSVAERVRNALRVYNGYGSPEEGDRLIGLRIRSVLVTSTLVALLPCLGPGQDNDPLAPNLRPKISNNPADYPANVWVTGSLAKIGPTATPGSVHWAEISAARNEFESFQVHVRAGDQPMQVEISVSDFTGVSGQHIPANPNIQVFRESYSNVRQVSDLNGKSGLIPDALIPVRDWTFHELRNAFPVTIPPNQTRSAWIDVFVPPATPSGYYSATITVKDSGRVTGTIPAVLKVWGIELPSASTLKSAFGLGYGSLATAAYKDYAGAGRFPGAKGDSELGLALAHAAEAAFFLDHRVSISSVAVQPTVPLGNWSQFDKVYGPLLDGTAQTLLRKARLTAMQYPNTSNFDRGDVRDWMAHFQKKGWSPLLFNYICDEPPVGCNWSQLAQKATSFRAVALGLKNLVTTNIEFAEREKVIDKFDILAVVLNELIQKDKGNQRSRYDAWLAQPGKELWWYQSCNQHESCANGTPGPKSSTWPSYMIDASPVRNRIFQWMAFLYGVQGELYYLTDLWKDDPWDHLYDFGGNGDGALFYPGTVDKIGGRSPTPVASIRLKLIRDGMEDYEYLIALQKAGKGSEATRIARTFIQSITTFDDNPQALYSAREQLGTNLHVLALHASH